MKEVILQKWSDGLISLHLNWLDRSNFVKDTIARIPEEVRYSCPKPLGGDLIALVDQYVYGLIEGQENGLGLPLDAYNKFCGEERIKILFERERGVLTKAKIFVDSEENDPDIIKEKFDDLVDRYEELLDLFKLMTRIDKKV